MKMNRLIPMLPVKNMPVSVEFYRKLGFSVERQEEKWGWAMLRYDDCRLMLDQSIRSHAGLAPAAVVYFYPDDIVEYHRQVRAQGVKVPELEVAFYGMKEFRMEDPDGNRLWIGQQTT